MKKVYNGTLANKKLAAYSAMAGALTIAGAGAVSAQNVVVYTDVDPDESFAANGDLFELDLNDDGVVDFQIYKYLINTSTTFSTSGGLTFPGSIQFNHIFAIPGSGNAVQGSVGPYGYSYPFALDAGDNIGDGEDFVSGSAQSVVYSRIYNIEISPGSMYGIQIFSDGNWFGGQTDKYLGLRFDADGNDHYGWLRMDVAADNIEFTVKDYAFNSVAEMALEAGQSELVSIDNKIDPSLINAYSYGNTIYVNTNNLSANNATIQVTNTLGEVVYNNQLNLSGMAITLDQAADGLYMIHIIADGASYTKQVFIN
jgi:hypothetical protein